jgi:hypothetical protein
MYDDYSWQTFVAQVIASIVLTLLIKGGVALFGHWIAWGFAALIAVVICFGGILILDSDDIHHWFT